MMGVGIVMMADPKPPKTSAMTGPRSLSPKAAANVKKLVERPATR